MIFVTETQAGLRVMFSDCDLVELHAMAKHIGAESFRRRPGAIPCYTLSAGTLAAALEAGAVESCSTDRRRAREYWRREDVAA